MVEFTSKLQNIYQDNFIHYLGLNVEMIIERTHTLIGTHPKHIFRPIQTHHEDLIGVVKRVPTRTWSDPRRLMTCRGRVCGERVQEEKERSMVI